MKGGGAARHDGLILRLAGDDGWGDGYVQFQMPSAANRPAADSRHVIRDIKPPGSVWIRPVEYREARTVWRTRSGSREGVADRGFVVGRPIDP